MPKGPLGAPRPLARSGGIVVKVTMMGSVDRMPFESFKSEAEHIILREASRQYDGDVEITVGADPQMLNVLFTEPPSIDDIKGVVLGIEEGSEAVEAPMAVRDTKVVSK